MDGVVALTPLPVHEGAPELLLGRELVVGTAAESEVVDGRLPALRDREDVVVLESPTGRAPLAGLRADVGATPGVTRVHGAPHCRGDIARAGARLRASPRTIRH